MANWTILDLQEHAGYMRGYACLVLAASSHYGIPVDIIFGLGSRETGWQDITGDGGHGRGIMQIDDRTWRPEAIWNDPRQPIPRPAWVTSNNASDPGANIAFACALLREDLDVFLFRNEPQDLNVLMPRRDPMSWALAAYNCGLGAEEYIQSHNLDPDAHTTHRDYSADILSRAQWWRTLQWAS